MKKQIISLALISSLALSGCGTQNNSASSDGYTPQTEAYTEPDIVYDYYYAVDLVGEAISDIEASGFDCSMIYNLTEYEGSINTSAYRGITLSFLIIFNLAYQMICF